MDFIVLLIIWLWIIFTTWKTKIEKKGWLLFIFLIYLIFLLWTWYMEFDYVKFILWNKFIYSFSFSDMNSSAIIDFELFIAYLIFFWIFYIIIYAFYSLFLNKKIILKKKIYFFLRDFIILFLVFCFFWVYNDIVWKYIKYHDWYKNPDNFWWEEFVCLDNSVTLLLEQNYRHPVIVNPYNNFYEFYKHFWEPIKNGTILTNKLPELFTHEDFLITCKNKKWENYYEKYRSVHGSEPYHEVQKNNYFTEKYSLSDNDQSNLFKSLREKNPTALKYVKQVEKTIHTQINWIKTTIEIHTDTFGSWYCRGWKLILENNFNTFTLFEHDDYCIVHMHLNDKNILEVSLNYGDGWWSGEWIYLNMTYDLETRIWKFLHTWKEHSHDWFGNQNEFIIEWNKVIFPDYEYVDERLDDVYKYFQENYIVK